MIISLKSQMPKLWKLYQQVPVSHT